MKKIKLNFDFLKNIIRKDSPESSKRFMGIIGYAAATIVICVFKQDYILQLLYTSAILIGAGITDSLINKIK